MRWMILLIAWIGWAQGSEMVVVGGDRDAHGCIASAGYHYSPSLKNCIRSWEYYTINRPTSTDPVIQKHIDTITQNFIQESEEDIARTHTQDPSRYTLNITLTRVNDPHLHVTLMQADQYTAGAHGSHTLASWNYRDSKLLVLKELLTPKQLQKISQNARITLAKALKNSTNAQWLREGLDPSNPENYATYLLHTDTKGNLISMDLHFAQYQVAAYAAGAPAIRVEFPSLRTRMIPQR